MPNHPWEASSSNESRQITVKLGALCRQFSAVEWGWLSAGPKMRTVAEIQLTAPIPIDFGSLSSPYPTATIKEEAGWGYDSCSLFNFIGSYRRWGNLGWLRVDASQWAGGRRRALGRTR